MGVGMVGTRAHARPGGAPRRGAIVRVQGYPTALSSRYVLSPPPFSDTIFGAKTKRDDLVLPSFFSHQYLLRIRRLGSYQLHAAGCCLGFRTPRFTNVLSEKIKKAISRANPGRGPDQHL